MPTGGRGIRCDIDPAAHTRPVTVTSEMATDEMDAARLSTARPPVSALARLFRPMSRGRTLLERAYDLLARAAPTPPPYEFHNLARWVKTLELLEPVAKRGGRWVDIASDPWFCAIAVDHLRQLGPIDLTPTGMTTDATDIVLGQATRYRFAPARLLVTPETLDLGLGHDFDVVMALEMIEHLKFHPAPFMAAMNAALVPGGTLVLTTPNVASWASIDRLLDGATPHLTPLYGGDAHHRKEYTVWEMRQLVEAAGFRIDKLVTFDCYPGDHRDLRRQLHYLGTLAWHGATLQPRRVRNLLAQSGSTMFVAATKIAPCDLARVAAVSV